MKKTIFGVITMVAFFAFSCQNAETNAETESQEKTEQKDEAKAACCQETVELCDGAKTVDEVLANFESLTDQDVAVYGKATHVCAHGGQRLFLTAENSDDVMVVTTNDVFPEDLVGQNLLIKGKIVLGEVEHNHDIEEEEHIEDEQHEKAHEKTFILEAASCNIYEVKK